MGTLCRERGCKVKQKRYSRKFQQMAVERMRNCEDVGELAQELGVTRRCLYKWRAKLDLVEPGEESARPSTHESSYRKQAQQLKRPSHLPPPHPALFLLMVHVRSRPSIPLNRQFKAPPNPKIAWLRRIALKRGCGVFPPPFQPLFMRVW